MPIPVQERRRRIRDTYQLNPLRAEAIALGLLQRGERDISGLPVTAFRNISRAFQNLPRPGRALNYDAARMIARTLLTKSNRLSTVSFVCVANYISRTRWPRERPTLALTPNEQYMFERVEELCRVCAAEGVVLEWRLILADAWGLWLFRDRSDTEAIEAYCCFMEAECAARNLAAIRWTTMVASRQDLYDAAVTEIRPAAAEKAEWEAKHGEEVGQTKPQGGIGDKKLDKKQLAQRHIEMRAAEGRVILDLYGPTMVLSTEDRGDRRYDHILVDRASYPALDYMPYAPQHN